MTWAELVSTAFAPELFVLVTTLLLMVYETGVRNDGWDARGLGARLGTVLVAWALAFAVYQGGPALVSGPVPGGEDFFASVGLIVGFAAIWTAWRRWAFGPLVPTYCLLLVATSAVHVVVVPVWDISSHVVYAAVPVGYLTTVDRRFAPLAAIPLALVWSRLVLDAHTIGQSVGGVVLAVALVAGVLYSHGETPEATAALDG